MTNLTDIRSSAISAAGAGLTVYATKEDLPSSGLTSGDQAYVTANSRLYVSNGSGWYNVALINATPSLSISPTGTIELNTDGSTTTITLTATDSDNAVAGLTYSVESDGSFGGLASLSQDSSVFTITPLSEDSATTTSAVLTFKASDGINFGSGDRTLTLNFKVQYSNYTTLLLKADNNGGTLTDHSSNAYTVTGSAVASSFSPYHPGGYSLYLDGNDYADLGFSTTVGTGDFTFECWYKTTVGGVIMGKYPASGSVALAFEINTSDGGMASHTGGGTEGSSGVDRRDGKWHYGVWERHNGTYNYYTDNNLDRSISNSENDTTSGNYIVGRFGNHSSGYFTGELRDIRFTIGTARYGGSAPGANPTTPATATGSENVLVFTGLPYAKDISSNNYTLTLTGAQLTRSGPYDYEKYTKADYGGSVYTDGTNTATIATQLTALGTSEFTIEGWWYPSGASLGSGFYAEGAIGGPNGPFLRPTTGYFGNNGTYNQIYGSDPGWVQNTWNHWMLTHDSSNVLRFYLNGNYVSGVTRTISGTATSLDVGNGYQGGAYYSEGYHSDVRRVIGTARETGTGTYTIPTEPLTAISGTSALLGKNDAKYFDVSGNAPLMTPSGSVTTSTSEVAYSGTSIYFSTRSDEITGDGTLAAFNTLPDDFTIELECKLTSSSMAYAFLLQLYSGASNDNAIIRFGDSGFGYHLQFVINNGGGTGAVYNVNLVQSDFTSGFRHIAWTRESGTNRVFIDGTQYNVATGTNPSTFSSASWSDSTVISFNNAAGIRIGRSTYAPLGYLQNIRVTNGLARYTTSFTPPIAEFSG